MRHLGLDEKSFASGHNYASVLTDEYTLKYEYADDISRIEWSLAEPTRLQKRQDGAYDIVAGPDGTTTVTYTLAVDVNLGMFGMFRSKAEKAIMDFALRDLKRRVESLST